MTPEGKLLRQAARRQFAQLAAQPDASVDLAHAALLIAAEERPGIEVERYRRALYEMGLAARERVAQARESAMINTLNEYVFGELGFAGNERDYNDPRNSYLSDVIERRRGIPITLSVIYMEIGRRAGLRVEGVGFPRHFIVRAFFAPSGESALVDPFHCRIINKQECQERLDMFERGQVKLSAEHLQSVSNREILARILRNLTGFYARAAHYARAVAALERILLLLPDAREERRQRAALLFELKQYAPALRELQAYLRAAPSASNDEGASSLLKKVQGALAQLN